MVFVGEVENETVCIVHVHDYEFISWVDGWYPRDFL